MKNIGITLGFFVLMLNLEAQNVGVGTQSPMSKFAVNGNAAIGSNYVNLTTAPQNGLIVEDSTGIGTSVPISKLHVGGDARIGLVIPAASPSGPFPNYGDKLHFSGGPVGGVYDSDNSDPIWFARYNIDDDITELRLNVGDGVNANDAFSIGNTVSGFNFLHVQMDGKIGVGTDMPSQLLHIDGSMRLEEKLYDSGNLAGSSGDVLTSTGGGTNWADPSTLGIEDDDWEISGNDMYNLNSAEVGIGISNPSLGKLHLLNNTNVTSAYIRNETVTSSARTGLYNYVASTGTGSAASYGIRNFNYVSPNATSTSYGIRSDLVSDGTGTRYGIYSYLSLSGHDGSGTTYGNYTYITGGGSTGTVYGHRIFNGASGSGTEYGLFVSGEDYNYFAGNIGIGTTTPDEKLHVMGDQIIESTNNAILTIVDPNSRGSAFLKLSQGTDNLDKAVVNYQAGSTDYWYAGMVYNCGSAFDNYVISSKDYINDCSTTHTAEFSIASNGNVGIGVNNASYHLQVAGRIKSDGITESSDRRLKRNIQNIDGGLDIVNALDGVSYHWKKDVLEEKGIEDKKQIGLIAQDVEKVISEVVDTDNEGFKSIQYSHLVPVLIEAIKDLSNQNDNLRGDVLRQSNEIREMQTFINELKAERVQTSKK